MQGQVRSAEDVLDRRKRRKTALQCLEADIQKAKQPLQGFLPSDVRQKSAHKKDIEARLLLLTTAIATAQEADVSVTQAKRLQAEMRSQLTALEAGEQLEEVLTGETKGASALKVSCTTSL